MTTDGAVAVPDCCLCDGPVNEPPREKVHPPTPEAVEAAGDDGPSAHEVCLLKVGAFESMAQVEALEQKLAISNQFLAALICRLGREVRIHETDVQDAAAHRFKIEAKQEEGGFIMLRMKGAIIKPPDLVIVPGTRPPNGSAT